MTPVSSTNKTDPHDIAEILLKVALSTIKPTKYILFLKLYNKIYLVGFMVLNATFNNISAISWGSVLLVEETEVSGENY
jgi:hypothetical protein